MTETLKRCERVFTVEYVSEYNMQEFTHGKERNVHRCIGHEYHLGDCLVWTPMDMLFSIKPENGRNVKDNQVEKIVTVTETKGNDNG